MKKLAIVTTHPIQYYAPVFKLLSARGNVAVKIFYTWGKDSIKPKFDSGFGKTIEWDIPLLDGYEYEFLENISSRPGSDSFMGIKNPDAIKKIESFRPDAILVYGWSNQSHLSIIRYFKGKTLVWFRGDSNLIDASKGWKSIFRKLFLKWLYTNIDKAFYVGTANKTYFKKFGLHENQLAFAPHAIDIERFSKEDLNATKLFRKELGLGASEILLLFAGKFSKKKNPLILLEAFSTLGQKNVHLLFVGNGELEHTLKNAVLEKELSNVHFLDFQNQQRIPLVYQSCDLFCLPSDGPGETWGLAINEAMAAGKPVIVSDKVGCAKDLVIPTKNGYIFTHGNLQELSGILQNLIKNKGLLKTMGINSSEIIQQWSFSKQVQCIERELDQIAAG